MISLPPHSNPVARVDDPKAAALNFLFEGFSTEETLREALRSTLTGQLALVSSFGAESIVLLHMISKIDAMTPIIFLDTEMLFPETLTYQREVAALLGLKDVRVIRADSEDVAQMDPDGRLHEADKDLCCALRKSKPLAKALSDFDGWITGRKRYQSEVRAALPKFETDSDGRLKLNPLIDWDQKKTRDYINAHELPLHPLVARGYPSIGCEPCTSQTKPGEDARAGRWRDQSKTECGIHFSGGTSIRRRTN